MAPRPLLQTSLQPLSRPSEELFPLLFLVSCWLGVGVMVELVGGWMRESCVRVVEWAVKTE